MTKRTENTVHLRGFVGDYIKLPNDPGGPARFDIMTSDRLTTLEGEIISTHDWHTIVTSNLEFVEELATGALVDVKGRISSRKTSNGTQVEIAARELELVSGAKRRRR